MNFPENVKNRKFIYAFPLKIPSAAKVTKIFSQSLPATERFSRETKFSLLKSIHLT